MRSLVQHFVMILSGGARAISSFQRTLALLPAQLSFMQLEISLAHRGSRGRERGLLRAINVLQASLGPLRFDANKSPPAVGFVVASDHCIRDVGA